jgi:hypothetical protein
LLFKHIPDDPGFSPDSSQEGKSPFRQPHYLLVNLAIGHQGGDPSKGKFPARLEVDYVRVYRKQAGSNAAEPSARRDADSPRH